MSIVSVSRRAALPQSGQSTFKNASEVSSGFPWPKATSVGNSTGKSCSGTGTTPQSSQWIIGIGVPQYRCREISQGRIFQLMVSLPEPLISKALVTAFMASSPYNPSKPSRGELTIHPWAVSAESRGASASPPSSITRTRRIGISNAFAKSKSRSSWPGTAITAPVPYEAMTKFPIQIGIRSPVRGWRAKHPEGTPFFFFMLRIRSNSAITETSS